MDNDQKQPEIRENKLEEIMKELSVRLGILTTKELELLQELIHKLIVLKTGQRQLHDEEMRLVGWGTD